MGNVASAMSPGYLQINPYFNKGASKLSRQYGNSNEKPESEPVKKSESVADKDTAPSRESAIKSAVKDDLTEEEKAVVSELKNKEREVISHEAAHIAAGGRFVGSPSYTRTVGPDGKSYITGGEVPITVPASSDPEETARNMQQVRAAALAPVNPSTQDINVAAAAANAQAQAEAELAAHQAEWGREPQPPRNNFDDTDRVPAEVPMVKKYRSSVNEGPDSIIASMNRIKEEVLSNIKTLADTISMADPESFKNNAKLAPENNLYNIRQAIRIYYMTSSPKGLWTVGNGFEKTLPSSPALAQAQFLNIAA